MNGGFGLLLDGSDEAAKRASLMLNWDVSNGVSVDPKEVSSCAQTAVDNWLLSLCAAGGSPLLVWKLQRL